MRPAEAAVRRAGLASVGLVLLSLTIGAAVGGVLDYRAWHANAAFEAAIPVLLAIVVAIGAGIAWLARRQRSAGIVAMAAIAFVVGFRFGAWVAPSANRPEWSRGTIALDIQSPALGTASGAATCITHADGSFSVGSDRAQSIAGTLVVYYLSSSGSAAQDRDYFELSADPAGAGGPRWDTNVEGNTSFDVRIEGVAAAGRADLVAIPRNADSPLDGGFPGVVPEAIGGVLVWTCEAPRGEPSPIEGSWFR